MNIVLLRGLLLALVSKSIMGIEYVVPSAICHTQKLLITKYNLTLCFKIVNFNTFSPFTFAMVRREEGAVVGTLEVEDQFEDGITYCRIDTENVVSR